MICHTLAASGFPLPCFPSVAAETRRKQRRKSDVRAKEHVAAPSVTSIGHQFAEKASERAV
ncbi:MAG: hypothetical protein PUK64_11755 [bacterium]|nr:hypothetical protein [bacterium]